MIQEMTYLSRMGKSSLRSRTKQDHVWECESRVETTGGWERGQHEEALVLYPLPRSWLIVPSC